MGITGTDTITGGHTIVGIGEGVIAGIIATTAGTVVIITVGGTRVGSGSINWI